MKWCLAPTTFFYPFYDSLERILISDSIQEVNSYHNLGTFTAHSLPNLSFSPLTVSHFREPANIIDELALKEFTINLGLNSYQWVYAASHMETGPVPSVEQLEQVMGVAALG